MTRRTVLFVVLTCFTSLVFASKLAVLPEILKPEAILVDNGKMFITQGINVYIYSIDNYKLLKKIGKQGEGPREFIKMTAPWLPSLYVFCKPDRIVVNSIGKLSFFTMDGDFIKEVKTSALSRVFIPFGEKYIGFGFAQEKNVEYFSYNLHDSRFKKEKEVFRVKHPQQAGRKVNPIVMALIKNVFYRYTSKNNVLLPAWDGVIHVFDEKGNEVYTIKPDYQKVELTAELKKKYDLFFRKDIRFKDIYSEDKARGNVEFPGYLALLKDYRVADDKIYIIGNKQKDKKYESFIYDLKGKFLKKVWLPLIDKDLLELYPFTIKDGKIYQLIESENEEKWELHVTKIE